MLNHGAYPPENMTKTTNLQSVFIRDGGKSHMFKSQGAVCSLKDFIHFLNHYRASLPSSSHLIRVSRVSGPVFVRTVYLKHLEKMFLVIFLCLCSWSLEGVFGSESVMEGDSVLLSVNITEAQRRDGIMWTYGPHTIPLAKLNAENNKTYNGPDGRFKDRLKLSESGSLIITDIRIKHSGLYYISTTTQETPLKIFNITVYTRLPVPVITNSSSLEGSSGSKCVLLCSVMDVSHVSLSWYKGKSLLSSISVSEHRDIINISLHLECLDDSYTCVLNNPITNQTQHLTSDDCQPCPERSPHHISDYIIPLSGAAGSLTIVTVLLIFCVCRKNRKTNQDAETDQAGEQEITYADTTFCKRAGQKPRWAVEDDVVYAGVMRT
ncbi:hepatic and glial cell adhesion molecule-like [Triplophysa rosa]|uniref:hepatic and glial cell adhesion molecule-like n=1 Tax=Triplophysa rosa TaxID=992332 RepID=UPI0025461555|nr:hepatic and glial cell adhesion molecule-like [Triplophysa rosa]